MFAAWLIKLLHNDEDIKYMVIFMDFYSFINLILFCLWERNVK